MRKFSRFSLLRTFLLSFAQMVPVLAASVALADSVVAPNGLATSDAAFGAGTLRASNYRAQQV